MHLKINILTLQKQIHFSYHREPYCAHINFRISTKLRVLPVETSVKLLEEIFLNLTYFLYYKSKTMREVI